MNNLYANSGNEEKFSVIIIDQYSKPNIESQEEVDFATLSLMLQVEYVTVSGKTIKKRATRVDDKGNVYFYGTVSDTSII